MNHWTKAVAVGGAIGALWVAGCCCEDEEGGDGTATPEPVAAPVVTPPAVGEGTATPTPPTPATPTVAAATANTAAAAPIVAPPVPDGASNVPTTAEWNAVTREVTVKGSSALSCETKQVREWIRISCRGRNDTGGTPTSVVVTRGGGTGRAYSFVASGVTSLVYRFVSGTHLEAVFSWTDKSHKLVARWERGDREPGIKAVFEGAASPLDRPATPAGGGCRRSADCGAGKQCCFSTGPAGGPACYPGGCGEENLVVCSSTSDCPSGWGCGHEMYESFGVCLPGGS